MEEKIKKIVQMALEEVNEDADEVIEYGENAALFGKGEGMDSFFLCYVDFQYRRTDSGAVWEKKCILYQIRFTKRNIILSQR